MDQMLMRLGRWLRLLGQDVANPDAEDDRKLLQKAIREDRVLITRDRKLAGACRSLGAGCILIESSSLPDQLLEMEKHGIALDLNPSRCTICNCQLAEIETEEGRRWICEGCGKIYWQGSHWTKMQTMIEALRSEKD